MEKFKMMLINQRYGCFTSKILCKCGKTLITKSFNWDSDRLTINDDAEVKRILLGELAYREINYCSKCGRAVFEEKKEKPEK